MKKVTLLMLSLAIVVGLASLSSAYSNYRYDYTVRESFDDYGYSYTKKIVNEDPWGKTVSIRTVKDYDTPRSYYIYRNRAYDYWDQGVSGHTEYRHLGSYWDDSYRRDLYDSEYHPYYYEPRYNGNYWDWN